MKNLTLTEPSVMRSASIRALRRRATALLLGFMLCAPPLMANNTGYLFVSSEKDHNVTVLDGKTFQVVKRISTAARPRHMAFSPDRRQIYVACGDGDAIDIIDVQTLALSDRILGIEDPEAFQFSPDGKTLYISLEDDAKLGILDLAAFFAGRDGKPELTVGELSVDANEARKHRAQNDGDGETVAGLKTVNVGAEPEGILVSPSGDRVFVTSEVANMVHILDTTNGVLSANVVVGNRPRRMALDANRTELWITAELAGAVSILDLTSTKVTETIVFKPKGFRAEDVTPVGVTMTRDGKTAWVALGRANHVAVVNVAARKIEDYVLVGNRPWNVTLSRDGSLAYVANGLSDDVSIIDTTRRKVTRSVPVGRVPYTVLVDD